MTSSKKNDPLYITYAGPTLLATPLLNKASAFSSEERSAFNLNGLLPPRFETIEEQVERSYLQYASFSEPLNKLIYLRTIQDKNETLFYRLLQENLEEMLPIVYTPTVGQACEQFSEIYRNPRGLFISFEERHHMDEILRNATKQKVKIIVVTDGERILGLGDQGIGGMGIPIGKLSLYTACGGISPAYTLPVMLDVGTNNDKLLSDPMYMGARHKRIDQKDYDAFVEQFITSVHRRWPQAMIQFEDFAQQNATPLLKQYRDRVCCFNDDIQGTAAVTVGTLLAACRSRACRLSDMKIAFVGAGSAGCGIAEQIIQQMCTDEITEQQARQQIFMIDRFGLVVEGMAGLRDFQQELSQSNDNIRDWSYDGDYPSLLAVMENACPDILIGVSGQPGLFSEKIIRTMAAGCPKPIIFPLSNPSKRVEATPEQLIDWTDGNALVATGSPFEPVKYRGKTFAITQCNNSYIFPGIGLGVLACNARHISDEMLMAASTTLANASPLANCGTGALLPALTELSALSKKIAFAVAKVAQQQNLALSIPDELLNANIEANFWTPQYRDYRRVSL